MKTKFNEFINEGNDEEYEKRFGKKETYEELKDFFEEGETVTVTRYDRQGGYEQDCKIKEIYFDDMEGKWCAKLDNKTTRYLNQLHKIKK